MQSHFVSQRHHKFKMRSSSRRIAGIDSKIAMIFQKAAQMRHAQGNVKKFQTDGP
jgi:hypothetical protein